MRGPRRDREHYRPESPRSDARFRANTSDQGAKKPGLRDRSDLDARGPVLVHEEQEPTGTTAARSRNAPWQTAERHVSRQNATQPGGRGPRSRTTKRSERSQWHRRHASDQRRTKRRQRPRNRPPRRRPLENPWSSPRRTGGPDRQFAPRRRRYTAGAGPADQRPGCRNQPGTATKRARHTQDSDDTAHLAHEELTRCQEQQPRHSALST